MGKIRVLVADDSAFARELIIAILSTDKDIRVVGEAENGLEAIAKVAELKPDILTIDIEMPVMNGLEAIERIMASDAVPILVVTTRGDSDTAYAAISKGALDLVQKPDVNLEDAREFIAKIKLLSKIRVITHMKGRQRAKDINPASFPGFHGRVVDKVVAIASSTGGPEALSLILPCLPADFPLPVLVAQHISDGFVPGMVEWFRKISKTKIKVPAEGERITAGTVYVSPSEKNMEIDSLHRVVLKERHPGDLYHPSCDALLSSVARVYGPRSIGIILSGMGSDGVTGIRDIKRSGGVTIAQDEKTSIVFGMPKVAIDNGYIDIILPLEDICGELIRLMSVEKNAGAFTGI